jgi:uncharacterized RDD family membrane protein YckC
MTAEKASRLSIHTPEGVTFALRLAGPVVRFLAFFTDVFCILTITKIVNIFGSLLGVISQDISVAFSVLSYFFVSLCYGFILEWYMNGQTLGKRLFKLRVMDAQGLTLSFNQVVIRNLLRFVDALPGLYLVGGIALLFTKKSQRLGDLAANTIVVWSPPTTQPDLTQILSGKFNSFREHPHLCARLRQKTGPAEADIALSALVRRETIDPVARIDLFKSIAGYFKEKTSFPEEATFGLSDEQYVRNVADVLFQPQTVIGKRLL